ncbi:MAG TPA: 3-hydroxyacyl-CoA dehydrogenase [Actinomycetota bacterium]|nr:3-hydroxyacyl-CoA dehydrogenase [Actinomycetota bacterium]
MKLDGKTALVTGGASGLGKATTERLVEGGARVIIADLPTSSGDVVAKELGEASLFAPTDVTSEQDVAQAVGRGVEAFGAIHFVVNCAGVGWPGRVLNRDGEPLPLEQFEQVIRINLIGTFNVIRLAVEQMVKQPLDGEERGVVVMTASAAAFEGQIGQNAYSASKAGVSGMTLPLARDLSSKAIRVVTIAPGLFDTPMLAALPDEARAALAASVPHPHRLGSPKEYASLVAHIIENAMLNGETIRLDGAIRMQPR